MKDDVLPSMRLQINQQDCGAVRRYAAWLEKQRYDDAVRHLNCFSTIDVMMRFPNDGNSDARIAMSCECRYCCAARKKMTAEAGL